MCCVSATSVTNCLFEAVTNERERERRRIRDGAYTRITWGSNMTALKLLRHYPLVLTVKVSWAEGRALENEEGKGMGSAEFLVYSSRAVPRVWAEF
jgi:hypothetical protein